MTASDTPTRVGAERVPLTRLNPAPWNPRLIGDARFKNLCRSIEADPGFLDQRPILATADGAIYAGNMRYRAVQHLGWSDVPAIVSDIPEQLAKERALRDNAQWGEWQDDDLAEPLYELQQQGSALDLLGFEDDELTRLLDSVGALGEPAEDPGAQIDRAAELQEKWQTARGQLWEIGRHRLLCGDAFSEADYGRLLAGADIALALTDPPYGVGVEWGARTEDSLETVQRVVAETLPILQRFPVVAITSGARWLWQYPAPTWLLAWVHPAGMGVGPWGFTKMHPILVYGKDPYLRRGLGSRPDPLVLAADREGVEGHPTPKPLAVWEWLLERCSPAEGEGVLDPFTGSGTTLVAAERLGRCAYGLEIEPKYVAVVLERMAGLGLSPTLVEGR